MRVIRRRQSTAATCGSADERVGQGGEGGRAWERLDLGDAGRATPFEAAADAGDPKRLLGPYTEAEDWPLSLHTAGLPRSVEFRPGWKNRTDWSAAASS